MRIFWKSKTDEQGRQLTGRYGLIHLEYTIMKDGNIPYSAYVRSGGKRIYLLQVFHNPKNKYQVDPRKRLEFVGMCFDNYMSFRLNEHEKHEDTNINLTRRPAPIRNEEIEGIILNRIYKLDTLEGVRFYRVYSLMNLMENSTYPACVGYRDLLGGEELCIPLTTFKERGFKLVDVFEMID